MRADGGREVATVGCARRGVASVRHRVTKRVCPILPRRNGCGAGACVAQHIAPGARRRGRARARASSLCRIVEASRDAPRNARGGAWISNVSTDAERSKTAGNMQAHAGACGEHSPESCSEISCATVPRKSQMMPLLQRASPTIVASLRSGFPRAFIAAPPRSTMPAGCRSVTPGGRGEKRRGSRGSGLALEGLIPAGDAVSKRLFG